MKKASLRHKGRFGRTLAALAAAALVALAAGSVSAATVTGASGLIYVPSADTLATGDAEIAVRHLDGRLTSSFTYGIFERIEIALNNMAQPGDPADVGLVLKGAVFEETAQRPAVAVGFETGRSYAVVSKRLSPRVRAHAGIGSGSLDGVFAGLSLSLNTISGTSGAPATTVLAEVVRGKVNAGVRMVFSPLLSVDLALEDLKDVSAGVALRTRF